MFLGVRRLGLLLGRDSRAHRSSGVICQIPSTRAVVTRRTASSLTPSGDPVRHPSFARLFGRSTGVLRVSDMAEEWFTYSDLGARLGISAEAVRQKAIRHRWRRQTANDGKALVLVDVDDVHVTPRKPSDDRSTPEESPADTRTLAALDEHIATLRAILAKAEAATERERERADRERDRADQERGQVDVERGRANGLFVQVEGLVADRVEEATAKVRAEAERDRLQAQVQELRAAARRPWWRRLAG